jgi:hypothetical protein
MIMRWKCWLPSFYQYTYTYVCTEMSHYAHQLYNSYESTKKKKIQQTNQSRQLVHKRLNLLKWELMFDSTTDCLKSKPCTTARPLSTGQKDESLSSGGQNCCASLNKPQLHGQDCRTVAFASGKAEKSSSWADEKVRKRKRLSVTWNHTGFWLVQKLFLLSKSLCEHWPY